MSSTRRSGNPVSFFTTSATSLGHTPSRLPIPMYSLAVAAESTDTSRTSP